MAYKRNQCGKTHAYAVQWTCDEQFDLICYSWVV